MQGLLLSALILLIPLLLVLFLRTNAAILFFVVTGASTLQSYLDKDVSGFATALMPGRNAHVVPLLLFVLPFTVAAIAFRHTVHSRMLFFHIILGALVGLSAAFISTQFLPVGIVENIQSSQYYSVLQPYSSLVIAIAFLLSVVILWLSHPKQVHEGHGKH